MGGCQGNGREIHIPVTPMHAGFRLDHLLAACLVGISRSRLTSSIRAGDIVVDGQPRKNSYKLKPGEVVTGCLAPLPSLSVTAEEIAFPILYEDSSLLVLSKPPGLVVHPGNGNVGGTLVNGLVHHCDTIAGIGDEIRPGIVHRLDKDTSGIMAVAKTETAHRRLVEAFSAREVEKVYYALVHGIPGTVEGRVVAPIGRHPVHRQKMAVQETSGRYAASSWRLERTFGQRFSLLKVRIETGRTHQIRVHMAHLGHPVAGDDVYGPNRDNSGFVRQMLHAWRLSLGHPESGDRLEFEAPLWEDFAEVVKRLADQFPLRVDSCQ